MLIGHLKWCVIFVLFSVVDEGIVPGPERASDEIVLSLSKAIGVSFAFILVGAFLPLFAVAMYVCCASRSDSHSFKWTMEIHWHLFYKINSNYINIPDIFNKDISTQLTIYGCSNVSTMLGESCENVGTLSSCNIFQESIKSVATTLWQHSLILIT